MLKCKSDIAHNDSCSKKKFKHGYLFLYSPQIDLWVFTGSP